MKSRSETASRLLVATRAKRSSRATCSGSIGNVVPARRAGAERQDVGAPAAVGEALAVALELLVVGEEVVREEHGLGALQVRVARHHDLGVLRGRAPRAPSGTR